MKGNFENDWNISILVLKCKYKLYVECCKYLNMFDECEF